MLVGFWIFFIIICILGFSYLKTGAYFGFLTGKKKEDARQQPKTPDYVPPVTLDDDEIRSLGKAAADWCGTWLVSSKADHKWLVIEVSTDHMDCRSVNNAPPYAGYPHCTVQYSKKIDWDAAAVAAQKILAIVSARQPKMVSVYKLYLDGHSLILPTNGD